MSYEAWPSTDSARGPLPRIEDLPIADQGYEQEAVRRAFDSFYRHAAQLDASLKTLEAVEAFQRDAMELRNDLRSLRALGFGAPEPAWTPETWTYEQRRPELPAAVPRLAAEAALVIAVAVIAGVAHFRAWLIVALMAAAWAIIAISEWLAARARTRVPASLYEPLYLEEGEPAPYVEAPAPEPVGGWSAFEPPPDESTEDGAAELTMVEREPEEAQADPEAEVVADGEAPPEPGGEVEPDESAEAADDQPEAESLDPWESGFEGGEPEPEPVARSGLGRIRRRRR
jgi:hypothetical protein